MVKYRVIGFDCSFPDSAYVSEMPFSGCLSVVKDKSKAMSFYKNEMKYVEKSIKNSGYKFDIIGEVEEMKEEKPKKIKRKKG